MNRKMSVKIIWIHSIRHLSMSKIRRYDGLIITGAPIEHLEFEDVIYWDELKQIMDWSKTNVTSVLHICWGAQAALYHHYGINKFELPKKLLRCLQPSIDRSDCRIGTWFQ